MPTKPKKPAKKPPRKPVSKPVRKPPGKPTVKKPLRGDDVLWDVIARVKKKSKGDLEDAILAFEHELGKLDDATLLRVEAAFSDAMRRANDWSLWGAAYVIHGVISDDMFWDVRAGLVALGREVFEAALADPDSLASVKDLVECTLFEGFQYVPDEVLEERGLESTAKPGGPGAKITGKKWNMTQLEAGENGALIKRFPRLYKRFKDNLE